MSQWSFVIAAYAVTLLGVAGLLAWAFLSMRNAEAAAEQLKRER
jgi:Flp pilus assembly protein CpaB